MSPSMRRSCHFLLGATAPAAFLLLSMTSVLAQIPSEFDNLRLLPKDVSPQQLMETMRGFSAALDVDCSHCHVGKDPDDLSTFDFASDDKAQKRTARVMMEMVRAINEEHLPRTGKKQPEIVSVDCLTCHQGKPRPETLGDALSRAYRDGGIEAAIDHYRELRERYFGRSSYDFGPDSLVEFARRLVRDGEPSAAVEVLELNLEHFPDSAWTLLTLGESLLQLGERDEAAITFRKLLEVDPENTWARKRLDELRATPEQR